MPSKAEGPRAGGARLIVVRHASAGSRGSWDGPDHLRPLDRKGRRQAEGLARALSTQKRDQPGAILSSPYVRCYQTVEPLATSLGMSVEEEPALAEGRARDAIRLARSLIDAGPGPVDPPPAEPPAGPRPAAALPTTVLCTHGDIVPALLDEAAGDGVEVGPDARWAKGSVWVLEGRGGRFTAAHYRPPAV